MSGEIIEIISISRGKITTIGYRESAGVYRKVAVQSTSRSQLIHCGDTLKVGNGSVCWSDPRGFVVDEDLVLLSGPVDYEPTY